MLIIRAPATTSFKACGSSQQLCPSRPVIGVSWALHILLLQLHQSEAHAMSFAPRPPRSHTSNRSAPIPGTEQPHELEGATVVEAGEKLGTSASRDSAVHVSNSAVLTQAEMRVRRLAALSDANRAFRSAAQHQTITMLGSSTSRNDPSRDAIDLCSSSDDESNAKQAAPRRAPPSRRAPIPRPPRRSEDFGTRTLPIAFDVPALDEIDGRGDDSDSSAAARRRLSDSSPALSSTAGQKRQKSNSSSSKTSLLSQTKQQNQSTTGNTFQVCSYNLWFDPVAQSARMEAVADILLQQVHNNNDRNNKLWLIGFQEVTDSLAVHLFPRLERAGYTVVRQPNAPYGCAIAVSTTKGRHLELLDAAFEPYSFSRMGRGILHARVRCPISQQQILFCTTHLESWAGPHMLGSHERQEQALQLEAFCQKQMAQYGIQNVILTGDWNWDDVRPRSKGPEPVLLDHLQKLAWKDAWLSLYPKDPGYTYDGKTSPMLLNQLRRRFDRVLVFSSSNTSIMSADLVGRDAIPGLQWDKAVGSEGRTRKVSVLPSDHFGLVVKLQMKKEVIS